MPAPPHSTCVRAALAVLHVRDVKVRRIRHVRNKVGVVGVDVHKVLSKRVKETPRRSHPDRDAHKQASQTDHIASHHLTQHISRVNAPAPSLAQPARHPDRQPARSRTPAARLGVHADGRDGGMHLVAHEVSKLVSSSTGE